MAARMIGVLGAIIVAAPFAAVPAFIPTQADEGDWTVATLASDGSWGVATDVKPSRAIAAANRACQAMAPAPTDCGARMALTRNGWIVARLCGNRQILESGADQRGAEREAQWSERALRRTYVPDLPPCRPVFTVEPGGVVITAGAKHAGPL